MRAQSSAVTLDGSHGEGGGTLVRTALVMSAITQQPVQISDVRGATKYPGVDVEDLALISALKQITSAEVEGTEVPGSSFTFSPTAPIRALNGIVGDVKGPTGRQANALILLNCLQGVLTHAGAYSTITAEGETFGNNTLSYDAFNYSTVEALKKVGLYSYPTLLEAAFGRESSGQVLLDIEPCHIDGISWTERGDLQETTAFVTYSQLNDSIPSRAAAHLVTMSQQAKVKLDVRLVKVPAATPGIHITVAGQFEQGFGTGTMMGTRGLRVEAIAQSAFEQYYDFLQSKANIDSHLADQILIPCVFAHSPSVFSVSSISQRLLTAIWVIKQFMPLRITVNGSVGHPGTVSIQPA